MVKGRESLVFRSGNLCCCSYVYIYWLLCLVPMGSVFTLIDDRQSIGKKGSQEWTLHESIQGIQNGDLESKMTEKVEKASLKLIFPQIPVEMQLHY